MSIALFFLLSAFFLAALLGALGKNRTLWGAAGACLVAIAVIIVLLKPVQLPSLSQLRHGTSTTTSVAVPPGAPGAAGVVGTPIGLTGSASTTTTTSPPQS